MANDITQRLSFWEKFGYGLGDAGCNVVFQLVMSFMAFFYTDVVGLAPAAMGTLLLVVRSLMAFADPVMGAISDRTHTRWGKFRPYLLWMSIPYAVIAVAAFATPEVSTEAKLAYAYVTCALLLIVYSAINVPYCALGGVMTPNSRERVSLNGYRFFLATAGGTMVVAMTMPLVNFFGAGDMNISEDTLLANAKLRHTVYATGFPLAVALLATLAVLMFWACFLLTKERVVQAPTADDATSVWRDVKLLAGNDQWRVVALLNLVLFVAIAVQDGGAIYYLTWYVERPDLVGAFLTTGMLCSMLGALFAGLLTERMSKRRAYAWLQAAIIVASVAQFLTPRNQIVAIFVIYGSQQGITQMAAPILWSMMADTVDYGEFVTGRRITGLTFSGALLFLKIGMAIGGALLGWLLAYFDYQSQSATQSAETVGGILFLFTLVPAIGHALLIGLVSRYRLSHGQCDEIQTALHRRHVEGSRCSQMN